MRVAVAATFLFGASLLLYAALHDGGKYALSPWDGLRD